MKSFLISDNMDTLVGMSLAGIQGKVVSGKEEILIELRKAFNDSDIGIIILTELAFQEVEQEVLELKLKKKYPLITEIPDRHGQRRGDNYITKYINESIGIKL